MQKNDTTENKLLTISEASKYLSIHETTLRRFEKNGLVSPFRIGARRDRRYSYEMLDKILEKSVNSHN